MHIIHTLKPSKSRWPWSNRRTMTLQLPSVDLKIGSSLPIAVQKRWQIWMKQYSETDFCRGSLTVGFAKIDCKMSLILRYLMVLQLSVWRLYLKWIYSNTRKYILVILLPTLISKCHEFLQSREKVTLVIWVIMYKKREKWKEGFSKDRR